MNDPFFSLAFGWLYRVSAFPQDTACGGVVESTANGFGMMMIIALHVLTSSFRTSQALISGTVRS